jgi:carboxypeptidase family protein/carbohydrate-selective porin (OprB family)
MSRLRLGVATLAAMLVTAVASAQTSTVSGRVANEEGGQVAGAGATLRPMPAPGAPVMANMPGMNERTAPVGADGSFAFDQVAPGQYVLFVDAPGFERSSQEITAPVSGAPLAIVLVALNLPGAPPAAEAAGAPLDPQALLDRIEVLERRLSEVESTTVLSEPETRVRQKEVYVDPNGTQYDVPTPGATKTTTYQRERVYRRQTISEKIDEALADAEEHSVKLGVSAAIVPQTARQNRGEETEADGHAYQLASADFFFTAGIAQNTIFYADIVGLSGTPPDLELNGLTLVNGYSARLDTQNAINLREAWLRSEIFNQKLALVGGRLDLTNFFDRNAVANDETTQFLSDALVNNPTLGLATNGSGFATILDPKNGLTLKFGFQQSNPNATSLSESLYTLYEAGYLLTIPKAGEGSYRGWYRHTNLSGFGSGAWGLSLDQKISPKITLFGRYGDGDVPTGTDADLTTDIGQDFRSAGFQVANGAVMNPLDSWGFGYAETHLNVGDKEQLFEGYYNFQLSEKLRLSFHLTHTLQEPQGSERVGYFVPGIRLQATF